MVRVIALLLALAVASLCVSANKVNPKNAYRNHTGVSCDEDCQSGENLHSIGMNRVMPLKEVEFDYCRQSGYCPTNWLKPVHKQPAKCVNGYVDIHENVDGLGRYPCSNVDLMSYLSAETLGSKLDTSDIWGATLNIDGDVHHLAIVGHADGSSFVDISDSTDPIILGFLPTYDCGEIEFRVCAKDRLWRDMKVYGDRVFIVSENYGHGMQVVNLLDLFSDELKKGHVRVSDNRAPQTLTADYHYDKFGKAHNIALNEDSGFAYVIGSNTCDGGLHIVDVAKDVPEYAGCFHDDGYTHDCQCVDYHKGYPDKRFHGKEICFNFNEDTLTIVDVTDKSKNALDKKAIISRVSYKGFQYTHQGWITEDGTRLLMDDELDEVRGTTSLNPDDDVARGSFTRTLIWDISDLQKPKWVATHRSGDTAIDHNMYIKNNWAYQSNYCSGLRVMDLSKLEASNNMYECAYFDLAPYCAGPTFEGTWSNFPYYNHRHNYWMPGDDEYDEDLDIPEQEDAEYDVVYDKATNEVVVDADGIIRPPQKYQIVAVTSIERGLYVLRVRLRRCRKFFKCRRDEH
jgi:choice-of-anchor B domain-containing protein